MKRNDFLKFIPLLLTFQAFKPLRNLEYLTNKEFNSDLMPVLFLGHGSPMNAIEENTFVKGFREIAGTFPKPNAIICISAHWFTKGTFVTAMDHPKTIHDFGGFPDALFNVQYPAPGSPELAKKTQEVINQTNVTADFDWGLDHGTWSVVKHLYPKADVPVIQLSIDYTKPAQYHYELAAQLKVLRNKGVLIIGSGNIIHNLGLVDFRNINKPNYGFDWAIEAHSKINGYLREKNYQPLIDYAKQGKAFQLAIPTAEHYLPMIYTLGLQVKGDKMMLFNDELMAGSLSMTSIKLSE
jgi:4,5-DOPA dioxygenase extradiol